MSTPDRPGWYADPLKPTTQERRWDGADWTDDTREASVPVSEQPAPPAPELVEEVVPIEPVDLVEPVELVEPVQPEPEQSDQPGPPEWSAPDAPAAGEAASPEPALLRKTLVALVVGIVCLVGILAFEIVYLTKDDPTVSSSRPVLLSTAAERSAADTAAKAAVAFTARSYQDYDKQVDEAAAMMTTAFAAEFRQTTDDAKAKFVEAEAEVTADVVAQGVMSASKKQVEVLIFLNQFTTKKDAESVLTPFRLKVTLIDSDQGWLVSDVAAN